MTDVRTDAIHWHAHARVDKFDLDQIEACRAALGLDREPVGAELLAFCAPAETIESVGNALTRQGLRRIMDRLAGTSSNTALTATTCRIGAGDGSTGFANTDTDLSAAAGSTHRWFQLVDSAPAVGTGASSGVLTFVATFATANGNFAWGEWGIDGGTASGNTVTAEGNTTPGLINRKVSSLGTKTSAASWVFTVTITIT